MFCHKNKLNEGSGKNKPNYSGCKELNEGENPKVFVDSAENTGWNQTDSHILVNHHWEHLRR